MATGGLAEQFEAPTQEAWMALVEKALKGADFDKRLVAKTDDGLRINPLYTRADAISGIQDAAPGSAPFTRGVRTKADDLGWDILGLVTAATPKDANKAALAELEGGANGLMLQVAGPGQPGINLPDASAATEVLTGVYLDFAAIHMRAGLNALSAGQAIHQALANLGADAAKVRGGLNISPIETFAKFGTTGDPLESAVEATVSFAKDVQSSTPNLKVILADGRVAHEAGASEATELAFLAAATVAYLRAFESQGVSVAEALPSIAFGLAADADLFLTTAKLRAARKIIWRLADAAGAGAGAKSMYITATTSERMMAKRDVWTNMLRTTAGATAAALGGANAVVVHPFTWALGEPDAFALRIARNQQIVAQEESSLGRVIDPAGGSWYIEQLTETLAEEAWARFQQIESEGGIIAALNAGTLQDRIAETATQRAEKIATGKQPLTGVSAFPLLGDDGVTVTPWAASADVSKQDLAKTLTPIRLPAAFEALRDAADAFETRAGAKPQIFIASLGSIAEHNIRTTWTKNFLAAGGIEALVSEGYSDADTAAAAFKESGAQIACLCSSDSGYSEFGIATVEAITAAGAQQVLLAGKPTDDLKAKLDNAGVTSYLAAGKDAIAVLKALHEALGVSA